MTRIRSRQPQIPSKIDVDRQQGDSSVEEVDQSGHATEDGDRESKGKKDGLAAMSEMHEAAAEQEETGREAHEILEVPLPPKNYGLKPPS